MEITFTTQTNPLSKMARYDIWYDLVSKNIFLFSCLSGPLNLFSSPRWIVLITKIKRFLSPSRGLCITAPIYIFIHICFVQEPSTSTPQATSICCDEWMCLKPPFEPFHLLSIDMLHSCSLSNFSFYFVSCVIHKWEMTLQSHIQCGSS